MALRPALFLDRDGVLNVDRGFVARPADFSWIDGAIDCIRAFNERDWWVIVVTNQTGIAHGLYTESDMQAVHAHMHESLNTAGARIDHIYHCPHHPDGHVPAYARESFDRKPQPGMLLQAMADYPIRRESSLLIGDKDTDIAAARAAGVAGFLYRNGPLDVFAEWALAAFDDGAR